MSDNPQPGSQPEPTPQPYGSQPAPGPNPYNQPGYGHTQGQPYTGTSGRQPMKTSQKTCLIVALLVVLVPGLLFGIPAAIGLFVYLGQAGTATPSPTASATSSADPTDASAEPTDASAEPTTGSAPAKGSCIKVTYSGGSYYQVPADCDSSFVTYTVTDVLTSGSCAEVYEPFTITQNGATTTYCLMVNLTEGKCYGDVGDKLFTEMACTDPQAKAKIVKRIDNSDDDSSCAASLVFPNEPKRVYCLDKP